MPLAALVVVPFLLIAIWLAVYGQTATSTSTADAHTGFWSQVLGTITAAASIGSVLATQLARWIAKKLGEHFAGVERLTVAWIAGIAHYSDRIITGALEWPLFLNNMLDWLIVVKIPQLVQAFVHVATKTIHWTTTRVVRVEKTVVQLPKLSRAQAAKLIGAAVAIYIAPYLYPLNWLRRHFHALVAVLPHALPVPFGITAKQMRRLSRTWINQWSLTAAFAGAVALAFSRLGLGFLRCNAFRRLGKRIGCGGFGWLEELLFIGFGAFVITDLCRFTDLLIKQAERIRPALIVLVDVEDALVGCHGAEKPIDLALPALSLSPMPAPSALAA